MWFYRTTLETRIDFDKICYWSDRKMAVLESWVRGSGQFKVI